MKFLVSRDIIPIYEYGSGIQVPYYGTIRYEPGNTHYYIDEVEVDQDEFEDEYATYAIEEWKKIREINHGK
jgi:hypothetical protein